jgi:hypothetical protein
MVSGLRSGHADKDDAMDLSASARWKLAVRGLRIAGFGLFVAVGGLVALVWSTDAGLTILAVGVGVYFVGFVVLYIGFISAIRALPTPRPSFWRLRRALMHDALHIRA